MSILLPWVLINLLFIIVIITGLNNFIYLLLFILEDAYPKLLKILCEGNVRKNIEQYQALTKLLAEILDFAFEFDYLKVVEIIYFKIEKIYSKIYYM